MGVLKIGKRVLLALAVGWVIGGIPLAASAGGGSSTKGDLQNSVLHVGSGGAAPEAPSSKQTASAVAIPALPPVTVVGRIENPATGKSTVRGDVIQMLPKRNGSINEVLQVLPDVQVGSSADTSLAGGEILPPDISISGGRTYQNDFLIDGLGSQSLLDPAADSVYGIPGQPQELFPDAGLVDKITVYDSNVPAEYGNFTGGVVSAETKSPGPVLGGKVFFRTTRSNWSHFYIDPAKRYTFENSSTASFEPNFDKVQGGVDLNLPIGPHMGLFASYRILDSQIPLQHLGASRDQSRRLENFFAKYRIELPGDDRLDLSALYTPYRSKMFLPDGKNSDFTLKGGGFVADAVYRHFFDGGELLLRGAYRRSENSRQAPRDWREWAVTDTKDWGRLLDSDVSSEGGFGSVEKTQRTVDVKGDLVFDEVRTGAVAHGFKTGVDFATIRGDFDRKQTTYVYQQALLSPDIACGGDSYDCVDGEQFFTFRKVYEAGSAWATINRLSLYGEDAIRFRRLSLRPGVRFTYDDFMHNANLAPRLAATYDLFGNGKTVLIAGVNRYYGTTLLTDKLREAEKAYTSETRSSYQNQLTPWTPAAFQGTSETRFSDLKTPYSDEVALGLDQALFAGRLSLKYVHREGKDEFARAYGPLQPDGLRYYAMNNNGSSRHSSYRLSWERTWPRTFFSINATYQQTTTSNADYDTLLDNGDGDSRVWYHGKAVYPNDLPRTDFNRPFLANLTYMARLPLGFSFVNLTRYRGSYHTLENTGVQKAVPEGSGRIDPMTGQEIPEELYVVDDVRHSAALLFDWKLRWQKKLFPGQRLGVNLEIYNVFNSKADAGTLAGTYIMGRQFWLGMDYTF